MIDIDLLKSTVGIKHRTAAIFRSDEYNIEEVFRYLESNGMYIDKGILGNSGREFGFTINAESSKAIFARAHVFRDIRYNLVSLCQFDLQEDNIIESNADIEEVLL